VAQRIDGIAVGMIAAGGALVYAGIQGKSLPSLITGFIQGKSPAAAAKTDQISTSEPSAPASSSSAPAGSGSYDSSSALQKLWTSNGGAEDTAAIAAAIAGAESGGSATVTSSNPDGGTNVGIFQLDTKGVGSGYSVAQLQNANLNTQITVMATNNGVNWSEWSDPVANALPLRMYTPGAAVPASAL
jgi:hypothetical protein